jgi:hypothetical protein
MNRLKIPENHSGISKTLRLPENIVDNIQSLANLKNLSFNRVVISLLEFSLNNLDEEDKEEIEKVQKELILYR